MLCSNCGNDLIKGANFCPMCGADQTKFLEPTPPRVEKFPASSIVLSQMLANVEVVPYDGEYVRVTITGDEATKQAAALELSDDTVMISAPLPFMTGSGSSKRGGGFFSGGGIVISNFISSVSMSNSGTSWINGQLFVDNQAVDMSRIIQVVVEVPVGTMVKVGKLIGSANIGNTNGDLEVKLSGTTKVQADTIRNLQAKISGSGDVAVQQVYGNISVRISGSGNITINGGHSPSFTASISGSGAVSFNGVAEKADMSVSGSGDIYLRECLTIPSKSKSGSGRISVGKAPQDQKGSERFSNW